MRLLPIILFQSLDKSALFVFLFVVLVHSFFTTPTFRIRAVLLIVAVIVVRRFFLGVSTFVYETIFRWGAIRSMPIDKFEPRPWPSDEPVLREGISKPLEVFLHTVKLKVEFWKRKKHIKTDLKPLYVYTAELKGNDFPPALSSFPSSMGPSTVVVYHLPSECRQKPYARFLLYHELGHLGLPSIRNWLANLFDGLVMFSILAWNLSRGPYLWIVLIASVLPAFFVFANPLARETEADTYAAVRVYAILGIKGLDAVIAAFERRLSNIADYISRTAPAETKPRERKLLIELKFCLSYLKRQRDNLQESGTVALTYDRTRMVVNCIPNYCRRNVADGVCLVVASWCGHLASLVSSELPSDGISAWIFCCAGISLLGS
jgi:hypothetical protein